MAAKDNGLPGLTYNLDGLGENWEQAYKEHRNAKIDSYMFNIPHFLLVLLSFLTAGAAGKLIKKASPY
jgi:hypothetical protein